VSNFGPSTVLNGRAPKWVGSYIAVPREVMRHANFSELSPKAAKLLMAIATGFIGTNNGQLIATYPIMKTFGFNSKDSVSTGLKELLAHGYLIVTRAQRKRDPAQYALSWYPIQPAKPGKPYDPGIVESDQAADNWRHVPHHTLVKS